MCVLDTYLLYRDYLYEIWTKKAYSETKLPVCLRQVSTVNIVYKRKFSIYIYIYLNFDDCIKVYMEIIPRVTFYMDTPDELRLHTIFNILNLEIDVMLY